MLSLLNAYLAMEFQQPSKWTKAFYEKDIGPVRWKTGGVEEPLASSPRLKGLSLFAPATESIPGKKNCRDLLPLTTPHVSRLLLEYPSANEKPVVDAITSLTSTLPAYSNTLVSQQQLAEAAELCDVLLSALIKFDASVNKDLSPNSGSPK
jgi:hypothetical protein